MPDVSGKLVVATAAVGLPCDTRPALHAQPIRDMHNEQDRKRDAVKEFLKQKDKNKDSSVSRDEYIADESDKEAAGKKFDEFNKNGDRALAKSEIEDLLGLSDK